MGERMRNGDYDNWLDNYGNPGLPSDDEVAEWNEADAYTNAKDPESSVSSARMYDFRNRSCLLCGQSLDNGESHFHGGQPNPGDSFETWEGDPTGVAIQPLHPIVESLRFGHLIVLNVCSHEITTRSEILDREA